MPSALRISRWTGVALLLAFLLSFLACAESPKPKAAEIVLLATTTSLADCGLLDALLSENRRLAPAYTVKPLVVGSGQSLALAARGEVDVLVTHDPQAEEKFLASKPNAQRWPLMNGRFVLAGPLSDPAKIAAATDINEAFQRIAIAQAPFISRGDNSGTHNAERRIWQALALTPQKPWYSEAGGGMAAALRLANERGAYLLTDVATFMQLRDKLEIKILNPAVGLPNPYSLILVDAKNSSPRGQAALAFARFLASPQVSAIIADFGKASYGQALFSLPAPTSPKPQ